MFCNKITTTDNEEKIRTPMKCFENWYFFFIYFYNFTFWCQLNVQLLES